MIIQGSIPQTMKGIVEYLERNQLTCNDSNLKRIQSAISVPFPGARLDPATLNTIYLAAKEILQELNREKELKRKLNRKLKSKNKELECCIRELQCGSLKIKKYTTKEKFCESKIEFNNFVKQVNEEDTKTLKRKRDEMPSWRRTAAEVSGVACITGSVCLFPPAALPAITGGIILAGGDVVYRYNRRSNLQKDITEIEDRMKKRKIDERDWEIKRDECTIYFQEAQEEVFAVQEKVNSVQEKIDAVQEKIDQLEGNISTAEKDSSIQEKGKDKMVDVGPSDDTLLDRFPGHMDPSDVPLLNIFLDNIFHPSQSRSFEQVFCETLSHAPGQIFEDVNDQTLEDVNEQALEVESDEVLKDANDQIFVDVVDEPAQLVDPTLALESEQVSEGFEIPWPFNYLLKV